MKKNNVQIYLSLKKEKILLCFIFISALFLRIYHFEERIAWYGDPSRDLVISKHIAFDQGVNISLGHTASGFSQYVGGKDVLHYPIIYYYYLSFLWKLLRNIDNIIIFNIFIHSLSVIPIYLIGKDLSTKTGGLLAALFFAISQQMVGLSLVIVGLHVSIPFILLASEFSISGIVHRSELRFVFGETLLIFFSTFNYAVLPIWGILFFANFFIYYKNSTLFWLRSICFLILNIYFFLFLHFQVINYFGTNWFHVVFNVFSSTSKLPFAIHFDRIGDQVSQIFILNTLPISLLVLFLVLTDCFFIRTKKFWTIFCIYLLFFGFHIIFAIRKQGIYIDAYLFYAQVAFIVFIGVMGGFFLEIIKPVLSYQSGKKRLRWYSTVLSVLILLVLVISSLSNNFLYLTYLGKDFLRSKLFANELIVRCGDPKQFSVVVSSHYDFHWESPTIWYWLEEISGENLYKITNFSLGIERRPDLISKVIFICKRNSDPVLDDISCHKNIQTAVGNIFSDYKQINDSYSYEDYQISEYIKNQE